MPSSRRLLAFSFLAVLAALHARSVASAPINDAPALPTLSVPRVTPTRGAAGNLARDVWRQAARLSLSDPWRQRTAFAPTEVLLLDTGPTLAIAFVARDHSIRASQTGHDSKTYLDDCVEIFLGRPEENLTESVGLEFNVLGALSDFRYREPELLDFRWNARGALVAVGRDADGAGYVASIEIPWSSLRAGLALPGLNAPPRLRANFGRWDRDPAGDVFTLWSDSRMPIPKPHRTSRYGWLIFPPAPAPGESAPRR